MRYIEICAQRVSKSTDIVKTSFETTSASEWGGDLYWDAFRIRAVEVVAQIDFVYILGISKMRGLPP